MTEEHTSVEVEGPRSTTLIDRFFDGPGKFIFPCYAAYREVSSSGGLDLDDPDGTMKSLLKTDIIANLKSIAAVAIPPGIALISGDPNWIGAEGLAIPYAGRVKGKNILQGNAARDELLRRINR